MYKVYCDNELIYSPSEDLNLINPKVELEVNKAGSFDFTILPNHVCYDKIHTMKSEVRVLQNDVEIFAGRPTDIDIDFWNRKKIHCEGELAYLNDSVQRPHEYRGVNVREYLKFIIDSHNAQVDSKNRFEVGAVSVKDGNDYLLRYTNWESTLSVLYDDLIKNLGGYFFIRKVDGTRYLDYLEDYNHTNTQKIEFGENMLDFSKNFDTTDIATCVIPLGARLENPKIEALGERLTIESVNDGVDSIISTEAANIYGKITKIITYDNVTVPSNLKRKGEEYLKFVQWEKLTLQAKAIDLSFIDGSFEQFKIGEYVRVVSKPHGMDANFPLTKMSIKLDKVSDNTVTLGNSKSVSLSSSSIEASSEIKKELDMLPKKYEVMKIAQDNATALLTRALGGFVVKTENELLIMDTDSVDTAKNVWRWNINGLGYSNNGYKGPFETAITMDGAIVADFLTVGEIRGENFNLDLNNGLMKFGVGSIDSDNLSDELKMELKGEDGKDGKSFAPNLIEYGDFTRQEGFNKQHNGNFMSNEEPIYNTWLIEDVSKSKVVGTDEKYFETTDFGFSAKYITKKINKQKKYYFKFTSKGMGDIHVYLKHPNATSTTIPLKTANKLDMKSDDWKIFKGEFTVTYTPDYTSVTIFNISESIPFCIKNFIISEEPIPDDTDWVPATGKDMLGPKGDKGNPGPPGAPGTLAELPESLKQWSNDSTEISGKYVFTPELFVGTTSPTSSTKTGVYIGKSLSGKDYNGVSYNIGGLAMLNNGYINSYLFYDGSGYFGRNPSRRLRINSDGSVKMWKLESDEIAANSINANHIQAATITAREIAANTITSAEIKSNSITAEKLQTGSITTDFLYPGNSERIIMERGYYPGNSDCKSIDASGNAIRLKVSNNTYIAMWRSGNVDMYSSTGQFFGFNPNEAWENTSGGSGSGELNLFGAYLRTGWVQTYGTSNYSDAREKENIRYIGDTRVMFKNINISNPDITNEEIIDFIRNEKIATYNYRKIKSNGISLIAQNVLKYENVSKYLIDNINDRYSVNLYNYTSMLHVALQEEMKKTDELKKEVEDLKQEISKIKEILNA